MKRSEEPRVGAFASCPFCGERKRSRQLMDWAKEKYGSVNRALAHYASRDKNRNH